MLLVINKKFKNEELGEGKKGDSEGLGKSERKGGRKGGRDEEREILKGREGALEGVSGE